VQGKKLWEKSLRVQDVSFKSLYQSFRTIDFEAGAVFGSFQGISLP
jgi:hypothetical protein